MSRPVVIGVVGGIGAGKSTVSGAFAEAGALVYDADEQVSELHRSAAVLDELRSWWGPGVVADGELDRAAVAEIVFGDARQRERLEGLLFPLLAEARAELRRRAEREGVAAVVIDAPLLIEAGLDAECDVVVFVDTPRAERLRRLRARSGWDAGELDRREQAQIPVEAKRDRADYTLDGSGARADVCRRARTLLSQIILDRASG
ncbi:MAG: dephospho-CoA kinase [Planctomycetota bacterium]